MTTYISTGVPPPLYVDGINSRVGIGTTTPATTLQVAGADSAQSEIIRLSRGSSTTWIKLLSSGGAAVGFEWQISDGSNTTQFMGIYPSALGSLGRGDVSFGVSAASPTIVFDNSAGSLILKDTGDTTVADASSLLELKGTTKGFLTSRMTSAQKAAIGTPATGLVVYDTTLNKLAVWTGAAWETVTSV